MASVLVAVAVEEVVALRALVAHLQDVLLAAEVLLQADIHQVAGVFRSGSVARWAHALRCSPYRFAELQGRPAVLASFLLLVLSASARPADAPALRYSAEVLGRYWPEHAATQDWHRPIVAVFPLHRKNKDSPVRFCDNTPERYRSDLALRKFLQWHRANAERHLL
jgi:hypothetical protein